MLILIESLMQLRDVEFLELPFFVGAIPAGRPCAQPVNISAIATKGWTSEIFSGREFPFQPRKILPLQGLIPSPCLPRGLPIMARIFIA